MRDEGGLLIAMGAGLALLVSIYNYFSPVGLLAPLSAIAGTPGALLVIFSTFCLVVAGVVLAGSARNWFVVGFFVIGGLVGIAGTALAAWLLDSWVLVALMGLCLIGWCMRVFSSADDDRASMQGV